MTANTWVRGWNVQSHSEPDKTYRVSLALGGHYGCSCPRWRFSKAGADGRRVDCKHILEIKGNLGLLNRVKGVESNAELAAAVAPVKIVRARVRTTAFLITELSAAELGTKRKVRVRDEF